MWASYPLVTPAHEARVVCVSYAEALISREDVLASMLYWKQHSRRDIAIAIGLEIHRLGLWRLPY